MRETGARRQAVCTEGFDASSFRNWFPELVSASASRRSVVGAEERKRVPTFRNEDRGTSPLTWGADIVGRKCD